MTDQAARMATLILANLLIVMAIAPCWAWALAWKTWRQAPTQPATIERVIMYGILSLIGIGLAVVGINYDGQFFAGHNVFPPGFLTGLGILILGSMDVPAIVFIVGWYRG